jgi:hypothetical protein
MKGERGELETAPRANTTSFRTSEAMLSAYPHTPMTRARFASSVHSTMLMNFSNTRHSAMMVKKRLRKIWLLIYDLGLQMVLNTQGMYLPVES